VGDAPSIPRASHAFRRDLTAVADEPRPPRRPPSDYRPDLRPMLILIALLALVVAAWILISPLILPRTP
jgi:hypothetical protein